MNACLCSGFVPMLAAMQAPSTRSGQELIDRIAQIIDYAAFLASATDGRSRGARNRARDKAREIVALIERASVAPATEKPSQRAADNGLDPQKSAT